jgi:hypothetical protein
LEKSNDKAGKQSQPEPQNISFNEAEGTYYERVFAPEKVRVLFDDKSKDLAKIIFEDKNGQSLEIAEPRLVSRVLMYFAKYTEFKNVAGLREQAPDILQAALNEAIPKRNKDLKAMYDNDGRLQGIVSTMHEQISWQKVKEIVEGVIHEIAGTISKPETGELPFKWTYKLPVDSKDVSGWLGVHAGNNIVKGRSGIKVFSRWRTEREEERGGIKRPACLNWCGMWQFPQQFFSVDMKRINSITKLVGKENVKDVQMLQFHIKPDMDAFEAELSEGLKSMVRTMEKIQPVFDQSIHSKLKLDEMHDILLAYQSKGTSYLPDYIMEQIEKHVEDQTIWGFSQAISWVRTHGEFKFTQSSNPMFKPLEDRDLVWRLENIAGEVLSLTPAINDIHKKHGEITLEFLVGKEKAEEINKLKQAQIAVARA